MNTRVCVKCRTEKLVDQFPLRSRLTHLRQSYCLDCRPKMGASWYEKNKEYRKVNAKKHK